VEDWDIFSVNAVTRLLLWVFWRFADLSPKEQEQEQLNGFSFADV